MGHEGGIEAWSKGRRKAELEYVPLFRQLEDAVLILWAELPVEQVKQLAREAPRLVDFIHHLHHDIEHEQAMVRRNVWAEPEVPHIDGEA